MEMYKSGYPSRHALRASGRDRDMLVEAFSKLPNLQTVGLRDYNARGRFRDGENAVWRSYGWSCNGLFTSDNARCLLDRDEIEASLPLILYALGHAHSTPGSLEVFLRHRDRLTPRSFNVLDGFMSSAIIPVLEGLKVLMLTTGGELNPDYMVPPEDPILDDDNGIEAPMRRFFHYTPNLETLRLNFQPYQWLAYRFLSWFAKPASVLSSPPGPAVSPVPPVSLPNLTKLDLGMLTVKDQTLLQVITKFDLTSLSLWKVTLQCDDPGAIYLPTHWADLLRKLSDTLPASTRLKHVLIGYASQKGHATVVPVFFKDSEGQQANRIEYRSRYGSNVKDWLRVRAAETAVEEPPVMDSSSESGNHSGEDTDGVDEEYEEDDESESSPSNSDDDEA
ncbi:hypothetical protein H2203_000954 [Taxawa tesnikishii (nom. ined.)]|nr:hypothetical protein H2203_000954 [Dothideales sp. JES 119]